MAARMTRACAVKIGLGSYHEVVAQHPQHFPAEAPAEQQQSVTCAPLIKGGNNANPRVPTQTSDHCCDPPTVITRYLDH